MWIMALLVYATLTFLGFQQHVRALELTKIEVPRVIDYRDTATLICSYNMKTHKLNSVKWYKDAKEFYRYSPLTYPATLKFPTDGITLEEERMNFCNKETCSINLINLSNSTSGLYRCEISGDAPEFKLAHAERNMTVAALPKHEPIISGVKGFYSFGEMIEGNCSSDMSSPPVNLSLSINGREVDARYFPDSTQDVDGFVLYYRTLKILYYLVEKGFSSTKNILVLKCSASIDGIPAAKRETTKTIYIHSSDELRNQKLINYRNSVSSNYHQCHCTLLLLVLILATGIYY